MTGLRRSANAVLLGAFPGAELPGWMRVRLDSGLGGVCLFGSNVVGLEELADLTDAIHSTNRGAVIAIDEEGGDVTRLYSRDGSPHPGNAALGAVDDLAVTKRVAASIGADLAAAGIDIDLAPCVDVNSNPRNPVIGVRSFGADSALVARHSVAWVEGLQSTGVAACAKHFPGHGDTDQDSHIALPVVRADESTVRTRELEPFIAAIDAGVAAVMTSHVLVPAFDDVPATFSRRLLTDVLKGELGFSGVVISDALDMGGARGWAGDIPTAAVQSLIAGADLLCVGSDVTVTAALLDAVADAIVTAVIDGRLGEERLTDAAARSAQLRRSLTAEVVDADPSCAADAASRAVTVEGALPPLGGAVLVTLQSRPIVAAGQVPWGPAIALPRLDPTVTCLDVLEGDDVGPVLGIAEGRPVVVVVRDSTRAQWVVEYLRTLHSHRADLVIVDMGWPALDPPAAQAYVTTHGASRASSEAVARLLVRPA